MYTCGSNLWWWQNRVSFTIHLNREADKYGSLLAHKMDIKTTKMCTEILMERQQLIWTTSSLGCETTRARPQGLIHFKHFFFFTVRVTEHWSTLSREVVQSPSLRIFKTPRDTVLNSSWPCFEQGGLDQQPFKAPDVPINLSYSMTPKQLWVHQKFEWMTGTMKLLGAAIIICFTVLRCRGKWLLQCS